MISTNRYRIGLLIALITVSCGLSPVIAQQDRQRDENSEPRFNVDFPGGALSEYVDAVRGACPDGANSIVVMPEAVSLPVPPIKLVAVTVVPAMQVLEGAYTTKDGRRASVAVRVYPIPPSGYHRAMKVVADIKSRNFSSAVWSVEEALINGQKPERILEAVEAAFSLFPTKADISYHPPTRLLIVRGTSEQVVLVREMLKQLIAGAARRNDELNSIRNDVDGLEADQSRLDADLRVSQKGVEVAQVSLDQAMKAMEAGQASQEGVAQAELQITRAQAELMMKEQERQRIEARLKTLREKMKRYESEQE